MNGITHTINAGYAVINTGITSLEEIYEVEKALDYLGTLYRIFERHPLWKPLNVDTSRPPGKSSGTGHNSFHIDCVNMEQPPRLVALHCLREDPLGGGTNILAPLSVIRQDASEECRKILRLPVYDEGESYKLKNAGKCLRRFPILPSQNPNDWCRWSGRFLEHQYSDSVRKGLKEADSLLESNKLRVHLSPGMTLVVDQLKFAHGREALGPNQESVPESRRRLLVQCYIDPERKYDEH